MMPLSIDMIAFMRPEIPAAGSEWPTLLLMEPMRSGLSADRVAANTMLAPLTSVGSPACVPVPWHSRYAVSLKSVIPAFAYADRIAAAWATELGLAIPPVLPLLPVVRTSWQ